MPHVGNSFLPGNGPCSAAQESQHEIQFSQGILAWQPSSRGWTAEAGFALVEAPPAGAAPLRRGQRRHWPAGQAASHSATQPAKLWHTAQGSSAARALPSKMLACRAGCCPSPVCAFCFAAAGVAAVTAHATLPVHPMHAIHPLCPGVTSPSPSPFPSPPCRSPALTAAWALCAPSSRRTCLPRPS